MSLWRGPPANSLKPSDVGFVAQSDLDPRLSEYLDKLKPKEVAPILTQEGIQLMQVAGRRSGESRPFEEVAPQIRRILQQQEMEKYFGELGQDFTGKGPHQDHVVGVMVRGAHPTSNFGGAGFQPVHRTGKMPVPPKTFQDRKI